MSTNFAKTLVWKHDYDVKLWCHEQRTPNTNDYLCHWMKPPHENFLLTPLNSHTFFRLIHAYQRYDSVNTGRSQCALTTSTQ